MLLDSSTESVSSPVPRLLVPFFTSNYFYIWLPLHFIASALSLEWGLSWNDFPLKELGKHWNSFFRRRISEVRLWSIQLSSQYFIKNLKSLRRLTSLRFSMSNPWNRRYGGRSSCGSPSSQQFHISFKLYWGNDPSQTLHENTVSLPLEIANTGLLFVVTPSVGSSVSSLLSWMLGTETGPGRSGPATIKASEIAWRRTFGVNPAPGASLSSKTSSNLAIILSNFA